MQVKSFSLSTAATMAFFLMLGTGVQPATAEGPAVMAPNFTLGSGVAVIDNDSKFIVSGKATYPLSDRVGLQVDASDAMGEGANRGGVAAHLFLRDPEDYLLGVTTMWARVGANDVFRSGAEGELYRNDLTFRLAGGWQNSDRNTATYYSNAKFSYYVDDNLVFGLGGSAFSDTRSVGVDIEWKPSATPFSLFAEGGDSNDTDGYAMLGLRYNFGEGTVSLKDRHRKYDPLNLVETFNNGDSGSFVPPTLFGAPVL